MKNEKLTLVIVGLIFTLGAIFSLVWGFSSIGYMTANDPGYAIVGILAACVCGYGWYRAMKGFEDPNQDYWRWVLIIAAAVVFAIFGGYHAQHKEDKKAGIVKTGFYDFSPRSHTDRV